MRYKWAQWGDLNAFFGLMLDNVAVMIVLMSTITIPSGDAPHYAPGFVITRMIPGTALGVLFGDLVYTFMAFRLARRLGRPDVTAMPLGLDTPSTFAVALFVLLPALREGLNSGLDHSTASVFGWHVGLTVLVFVGLFKTAFAPFGNAVRRLVPRAGLLGSLAAIALVLIAFLPLLIDVAALPIVGLLSLAVILVALIAHRSLPGRIPGALAAAVVGIVAYYVCKAVGMAPAETHQVLDDTTAVSHLSPDVWTLIWWRGVIGSALTKLPVMLPFALATIVGGIDCTESAAAAGDEYDTRSILLTEGLTSVAAGLLGGVIQTTPYIGQPAYKAMGGRAAYTLGTALFIGFAGVFGLFTYLFDFLPRAAMFPILVYVGLEITAQSFHATPVRHFPALALAFLPALAYMATIPLDAALAGREPSAGSAVMIQTLRCLANGFILTSLLWAAAMAAILDGRLIRAGVYYLIAAGCSLVGLIHSPLNPAAIALPHHVISQLGPAAAFQGPYHWAAAYVLVAGLLYALSFLGNARPSVENHA